MHASTQAATDEVEHEDAEEPSSELPVQEQASSGDEASHAGDATAGGEREHAGDAAGDGEPGPGRELSDEELVQSITALVFASPDPLSERRLVELLERPEPARVRAALDVLKARLEASGLPLELRSIAGGWQILTTPAMGETILRLVKAPKVERITAAALETLSIVAYRQPVTKADIEAIRGVQVGPILRSLVDRGLVRVTGRADVPGHPLQYGTTRAFLERFGLANLDDLPRDSELAKD